MAGRLQLGARCYGSSSRCRAFISSLTCMHGNYPPCFSLEEADVLPLASTGRAVVSARSDVGGATSTCPMQDVELRVYRTRRD